MNVEYSRVYPLIVRQAYFRLLRSDPTPLLMACQFVTTSGCDRRARSGMSHLLHNVILTLPRSRQSLQILHVVSILLVQLSPPNARNSRK